MPHKPPPLRIPHRPDQPGSRAHRERLHGKIVPVGGKDAVEVAHALQERIKELNCLYAITHLAEDNVRSIEEILSDVVHVLPPAWQYPEITCARIVFRDFVFRSRGYRQTRWSQSAGIRCYSEPVGEVTVCYLEERPAHDEGPFLQEERALLDAVAERIGAIAMRITAERELQESNRQLTVERAALQETNAALRAVLSRIEEEKREIHRDIRANVEKVLLPILHELNQVVPRVHARYLDLLRDNLEEITSPFINRLSQRYRSLTPTEIQICHLIRGGQRTKEIARIRGISPATVNRHRERIRRKLGIANEDANLASFLQMTMLDR